MKIFMCVFAHFERNSLITVGVKNALNKDCKDELNTQFLSSLAFEVQLKLLKTMLKLPICNGLMFKSLYA